MSEALKGRPGCSVPEITFMYKLIYVSKSHATGKTVKIACSHPVAAGDTGTGQRCVELGPHRQKRTLLWVVYKEAAPKQARDR